VFVVVLKRIRRADSWEHSYPFGNPPMVKRSGVGREDLPVCGNPRLRKGN